MPEIDYRIDKYFSIWALFLPITSVLLIPSVQGTTPGYLMAFLSLIFVPFLTKHKSKGTQFYYFFFLIIFIYVFVLLCSQLALSFSKTLDFSNVILIDPFDKTYLFKKTMFTQSLYVIAVFATFAYVRTFYNNKWDKYLLGGAVLLVLYGFYDFLYFFFTHTSGDFLTNRTFRFGEGSAIQRKYIGSFLVMRFKSLTGEPSMYALTAIPFWLYAAQKKKKIISSLLFISLFLSLSTTAFLAFFIVFLSKLRNITKNHLFLYCVSFIVIISFIFIGLEKIYNFIYEFVIIKLQAEDNSGMIRANNFKNHIEFFSNMSLFNQLFGVGFGYVRSTDMFTTLLINTGIIGFTLFTFLFFYPIIRLDKSERSSNLKLILFILYVVMMVSVPEYAYLSTWLFLGMGYNQIIKNKQYNTLIKKDRRITYTYVNNGNYL
ncbi:hypothetical protein [Aeribacillus pallidus]|uniref:hypothetical protein n=1 Tax=Aeribacillus pallidus TaxID=33936 RepID=UPI000E3405E2|nr:hypothetical protein [Aeribacillus pallidus]